MVRLRLQRLGRTHRPFYRLAAVDKRERLNGKVLENLGWYNPMEKDADKQVSLKADRIRHWLSVGAQPSDTVRDLLAKGDVLNEKEMARWEADRKTARNRVEAKTSLTRAQAAVAALTEFAGEADADISTFQSEAGEASKAATAAVSTGKVAEAVAAADKAEAALAGAKKADEEHKAKAAAAEAAAAEEAAKAEAAAAEAAAAEAPAEDASAEEAPAEG